MALASKDGGERITSYQQFVLECYLFGHRVNHGNYSGINLCISMHISVSAYGSYDINFSDEIHFHLCLYRLRSVSSVQVSEGSAIQIESTWWTSQYGYHHWRISFVDVAWTKRSTTISIRWLCLSSLQFLDIVSIIIPQRCSVASSCTEYSVLYLICRQHNNGKLNINSYRSVWWLKFVHKM